MKIKCILLQSLIILSLFFLESVTMRSVGENHDDQTSSSGNLVQDEVDEILHPFTYK